MQGVDDGVGVESDAVQLFGYLADIVWVCMSDGYDGMSSVEVEVFLSFVVPYVASFAADDVHVEKRIYGEESHMK